MIVSKARLKPSAALVASLASLVSVWAVAPAHAQFTENFNSLADGQKSTNFSDANPNPGWVASNGTYGTSVNDNPLFSFVTLNASGYTSLSSFTYTVDLLGISDSGVIVRSDATGASGLTAIVRYNAVNKDIYFVRRAGGNFGNVAFGTTSLAGSGLSEGENLRMTVTGAGDTFTASVARITNPSSALATINYTFAAGQVASSGRVGFYQYAGTLDVSGARPLRTGFDNLSVTNTVASAAAPEPGTLGLLCAGLPLGIVLRRRARR